MTGASDLAAPALAHEPVISERMRAFLDGHPDLETPFLLVDLDRIEAHYRELREALPFAACYYAVKANSALPVIDRLRRLGSRFETASIHEVRDCLRQGVPPRDIHFGNTVKKEAHIAEAYRLGVRSFTFDSEAEVEKLARAAPGSNVSCRLSTDGRGAVWGLSRKFGREAADVVPLLAAAHAHGLRAYGISFHVGSQQRDPDAWRRAIAAAAEVVHALDARGIRLRLVNLGGGFPSYAYASASERPNAPIREFGARIHAAIEEFLPEGIDCVMEPGRFIAAGSGLIKSSVLQVTDRTLNGVTEHWVYIDAGRFNGLYEAADVQYPIVTTCAGVPRRSVLAGPTCDSEDTLYQGDRAVHLPGDLSAGDTLILTNAGAYTRSYVTCGFNGFPPLAEHYL